EGQTAVMAARFLDGAWQMDPSPIWSGKKPVWEVAPGYDDSGVAHVLILFEDELLLATNAGGSWRTTPVDAFLPFVKRDQQYPPIEGYGVDGAGHLHVSFSTSATGYAYATDASGQWQITPLKRNPWGKT